MSHDLTTSVRHKRGKGLLESFSVLRVLFRAVLTLLAVGDSLKSGCLFSANEFSKRGNGFEEMAYFAQGTKATQAFESRYGDNHLRFMVVICSAPSKLSETSRSYRMYAFTELPLLGEALDWVLRPHTRIMFRVFCMQLLCQLLIWMCLYAERLFYRQDLE